MFEFDWRPLIYLLTIAAFMLLWIVGCTIIANSGTRSSPTGYPQVTLTTGRIVVSAIPTDSPRPTQPNASIRTLSPTYGIPISPPTHSDVSEFAAVQLTPPTCYATSSTMMRCLGRVDNTFGAPITRVSVRVRVLFSSGHEIERIAVIEQSLILSGGFAPYRVDFPAQPSEYVRAAVTLQTADPGDESAYAALTVDSVRVSGSGAFRQVNAEVLGAAVPLILTRAVITLVDARGRVYSYQVIQFEEQVIAPHQVLPINAQMQPYLDISGLTAVVHVEARKP